METKVNGIYKPDDWFTLAAANEFYWINPSYERSCFVELDRKYYMRMYGIHPLCSEVAHQVKKGKRFEKFDTILRFFNIGDLMGQDILENDRMCSGIWSSEYKKTYYIDTADMYVDFVKKFFPRCTLGVTHYLDTHPTGYGGVDYRVNELPYYGEKFIKHYYAKDNFEFAWDAMIRWSYGMALLYDCYYNGGREYICYCNQRPCDKEMINAIYKYIIDKRYIEDVGSFYGR